MLPIATASFSGLPCNSIWEQGFGIENMSISCKQCHYTRLQTDSDWKDQNQATENQLLMLSTAGSCDSLLLTDSQGETHNSLCSPDPALHASLWANTMASHLCQLSAGDYIWFYSLLFYLEGEFRCIFVRTKKCPSSRVNKREANMVKNNCCPVTAQHYIPFCFLFCIKKK